MNRPQIAIVFLMLVFVGLLICGCSIDNHAAAKQQALDRWQGVRSGLAIQFLGL